MAAAEAPLRAKNSGSAAQQEPRLRKERALLLTESIRRAVVVALTLLVAPALAATRLAAQELGEEALRQIAALFAEKKARTPAERKLDTALLYAHRRSRGEMMVAGLAPLDRVADRANVRMGMVVVDIRAVVTEDLRQAVADLGGSVVSAHPAFGALRARVPVHRLVELAARPEVRFVGPEEGYIVNTGSQTSQGDTAHAVASTRTSLGINGTGVKVGVLSDGVNSLAARQATGDLPLGLTVVPGQAGPPVDADEGTAMLEIVHDLAPGAQLFFATALPNQAAFASNILTLRNTYGCDIIVDDITYFAEGAFQDGTVQQAVNTVTAGGALFFSSAGNSGNKNKTTSGTWEGDYLDSLTTHPMTGPFPIHSFNGLTGGAAVNNNALTQNAPNPISLKWSDPLLGSANDYDLLLFDAALADIVDASANVQDGTQDPFEIIDPAASGQRLMVVLFDGQTRALRLDTNRGRLTFSTAGATSGHNAGASTITVAATDVRPVGASPFTAPKPVETYSSDGPRRMFLNPNGSPITPGNVLFGTNGGLTLPKPDLTAADCGITTTPGFSPFCGTSAAAPHAAAIAAVLKSISTRPSAGQVQTAMYASAVDVEAAGRDRDSGMGIVMASRSATALTDIPATNFFTIAPCRLVDTRNPAGPLGGPALTCGTDRMFTVAGACGIPASGVKAVSVNATVTSTTGPGNVRLFAAGLPVPAVSALNWSAGQTRGNNGVVPLNASGQIAARCAPSGSTHFILDVNGYFQ
jgi:Subtilase family